MPRAWSPLHTVLIGFVALALIYAWATPIFEASDELWHFGVIEAIVTTGELPVQVVGEETAWEQEGSQPPLYYLLASALVAPVNLDDFDAIRQPNPHARAGVPGAVDNKNLVLHETPHPLLQGTALAVYLVRMFSIVLGAITVSAVYASARLLAPERPGAALLAAGLTAFNPMFLFISASVNNDNLAIALCSLITWQMLLLLRDGFMLRRSVILAVLLALAALSKLSGLVLMPIVVLAGLWVAMRRRDMRGFLVLSGSVVIVWTVLAGWWYARNLTLYGELFGTQTMVAVAGPREEVFTLNTLLSEFQGFRISFWGLFGAVNVLTFEAFYVIMDILTVPGIIGLGRYLWRSRQKREEIVRIGLLALTIIIGSVGVILWTAQTYASQGRLLFPYIAAINGLLALGLVSLHIPARPVTAALALFAWLVPFASIAPVYARPPRLQALPESVQPVYARFDGVELVGYETPDRRYGPGDSVPITLYWHVIEPADRDLSLYLHAVDDDGNVLGKVDTYPGAGRLRTSTWEAGAIYADDYAVPLDETAAGQSALRIAVGWWHYPTETLITPLAEDGTPLESVMLMAGSFVGGEPPALPPDIVDVPPVTFGGLFTLTGYRLADGVLTLAWEGKGTPPANYTVFVQVLDETDTIVGQGDAPPSLPTRYWRAGDRFITTHPLYYPEQPEPGTYTVVIGWYNPDDFSRLGVDYPDAAYPLTTMTIE